MIVIVKCIAHDDVHKTNSKVYRQINKSSWCLPYNETHDTTSVTARDGLTTSHDNYIARHLHLHGTRHGTTSAPHDITSHETSNDIKLHSTLGRHAPKHGTTCPNSVHRHVVPCIKHVVPCMFSTCRAMFCTCRAMQYNCAS